ncbi:nuclear transport factor 2 family protein [Shewanella sp. D64]|uniref:nuclear transport factor 2 family protein n=1 Tax=unclassified Shewanella TaxID=196818 RepID=UPI0022BA1DB8|nr:MULTISPECIES: DUF4440 domain-containing protein [unclassified Shewanella]MEC4725872.1 nuclear transport factor 2 family protein [Shewanella sp. D64]MEC4737127.1 nuclear transport factor 2 family protein [Shewanella sp. E94]WBJ95680.1 nuclear transport factor 2 family protein [Shewanella sp. MTB7]
MLTGLKQQLIELELYLLKSEVRTSAKELASLIHDDFLEFGGSGTRFGKQEILSQLPLVRSPEYCATDFELRMLAPDLAQLLYRATMIKPNEFITRYSLRSSLWKEEEGRWQLIFHQGTSCEAF